jgi:hypothetical protein
MALNLAPWMEQLTIQKKDRSIEPLLLAEPFSWAQRALVREIERQHALNIPIRIIVLKGRQIGISTASEGVLFNWCFLFPGTTSLVIAHETSAARHLFDMTKLMWESWPFRPLFTEKHNTVKSLGWRETRSSMQVATARNAGSGRSFTFHALHASECAFWEDPERLLTGLNQTLPKNPGTIAILESTANGVGNYFHEEWLRARHGKSANVPMFFPWWRHEAYVMDTTLTWADLDAEERGLVKRFNLTLPQLAWRQDTIDNECLGDLNKFHQEYPCTEEEAFLSTGYNVFPLVKLDECFRPKMGLTGFLDDVGGTIKFVEDATGPLTIYSYPADRKEWGKYVVAGDPCRVTYGDEACIQVFNRRTLEQVAVWHGRLDPLPFAHELMKLGYYYNTALLNIEINGPGYGALGVIMELGYPDVWKHRWADKEPGKTSFSYGWEMSFKRKHLAVGHVIHLLSTHSLIIHDRATYDQMRNYVALPGGELGPAKETGYDDACTSLLIAIATTCWEAPLSWEGPAPDRVNDIGGKPPWEAFG